MAVTVLSDQSKVGRKARRPIHNFQLRTRPFQLQPFFIAPVLPGETVKNISLMSRTVTDPIKHPLIGWWNEYYIFYVPHRALSIKSHLTSLMLEPAYDMTPAYSAAEVKHYHIANTVDYVGECLKRVVSDWFRDEGEAWNVATLENLPLAKLNMQHFSDSLTDEDLMLGTTPNNTAEAPTYNDIDDKLVQWEHMRALQLTQMSYEEWLETFGVNVAKPEQEFRPELFRYVREYQYPSNTVDPVTGAPSSAVSWAQAERADKDRFIKEPGFLFGVTCVRPKVYLTAQSMAGVGMLDTAFGWMPALMQAEPFTSLRKYATTTGPFPAVNDAYWVDMRDLFVHGDQFVNFSMAGVTNMSGVALPGANTAIRDYPVAADINALFVGSTPDTQLIRTDGIVQLNVLGTQQDHTPRFMPHA